MLQECRRAIRSLSRRPGLSATIVLTLGLGVGANSTIFSAIDAILLKPLPYAEADRLVAVYETNLARKEDSGMLAPVRLEEWNAGATTVDGMAATYYENVTDTSGDLPERVEAMRTSPRFFEVLKTPPALGRTFTPEEERFGGAKVVVLSDAFWRTRLGADPQAVGRQRMLGGEARTIVGVMPPSFRYPTARTEMWIPTQASPGLLSERQARFYLTFARLKPGVTPEQAQTDLGVLQARLGEQFPDTDKGWGASVVPLKEARVGKSRGSLWLLLGAVLLVLLAACANVACLLMADAARREHDVAVRFALGADRLTLVRQLLTEGALLSLAGAGLGLLLAWWGTAALRTAATRLPRIDEVAVDWRLVAFTLALAAATTLVFALAPALQATRREVAERLRSGGRGAIGGRQPIQRVLVGAQVTLAIVLLVGAGLLVRSFSRVQQVAPGFDPADVVTFRVSATWSERGADVKTRQFRTLERLAAIPGVTHPAMTTVLPATSDYPPSEFRIVGRATEEKTFAVVRQVSAEYFRTVRIPILQGETCRDDPRADAPAQLLVSRSFAERYFPGESPVGHQITLRTPRTITGVVADVREQGLMKDPEPLLYTCGLMPFWPDPFYVVRTDPQRPVAFGAIRAALREIEPGRAVYASTTLVESMDEALSQPRLNTLLLGGFAATALLLAGLGLHGMLAQFVAQRRREIGVRMALGALPAQVLRHVLGQAAAVVGAGLVVGLVSALALTRFMGSLVWGISARDPLTFAAVPLVLAAIAAAAAIIPARRAVRVDPVRALRES
jgi:putative ABC transport system permease protein